MSCLVPPLHTGQLTSGGCGQLPQSVPLRSLHKSSCTSLSAQKLLHAHDARLSEFMAISLCRAQVTKYLRNNRCIQHRLGCALAMVSGLGMDRDEVRRVDQYPRVTAGEPHFGFARAVIVEDFAHRAPHQGRTRRPVGGLVAHAAAHRVLKSGFGRLLCRPRSGR